MIMMERRSRDHRIAAFVAAGPLLPVRGRSGRGDLNPGATDSADQPRVDTPGRSRLGDTSRRDRVGP
jgi:hypothetical protein